MGILNFNEIPAPNISNGKQDTFELFAREFFKILGFKIIIDPDRGQDGGKDLIIEEKRTGVFGDSKIKWLVSCKHKAHSGNSVLTSDEEDIIDRVIAHDCTGFIGFYSTIVSSPLNRKFSNLESNKNIEIQVFDNEKIESILLSKESGKNLIQCFFPKSYSSIDNKTPSNLFSEYVPLKCSCCGKDLLESNSLNHYSGIVVFVEDISAFPKTKYIDMYFACKGHCDEKLDSHYSSLGYSTTWEDISDLIIPYKYLKWNISILNRIYEGDDEYTEESFSKLKDFIMLISQIVLKGQSEEDIHRIITLNSIPDFL
ncbi:restriction endonuclease [Clostridium perfringens]|nr:restriction endonuclease [Clostridium perfringens]ELC8405546.1 restriction endonuclease [Clostridium perfringens]